MVPLGMGQPPALPRRSEDDASPTSFSLPSRRTKTAKTSPDYGHFARPWRIDQRLLAAECRLTDSESRSLLEEGGAKIEVESLHLHFESLIDHFRRRQKGREGPGQERRTRTRDHPDRQSELKSPARPRYGHRPHVFGNRSFPLLNRSPRLSLCAPKGAVELPQRVIYDATDADAMQNAYEAGEGASGPRRRKEGRKEGRKARRRVK